MKKLLSIILIVISLTLLSACDFPKLIYHFEDWCKTTDDGFEYYYNEGSKDGAYILKVPDVEELIIPEYIDGKKVVELGHCNLGLGYRNDYVIIGTHTKKLTVQHEFDIPSDYGRNFYANFPNLTDLIFVDFLYCNLSTSKNELTVPFFVGEKTSNVPSVELRKSDREFSLEHFLPKVIIIPEYVKIIEKDVFAGLTGVTIKTSYKTAPEGWQDGWNGDCFVEWGAEI